MDNEKNIQIRQGTIDDEEQISELMQQLLGNPVADRKVYLKEALTSERYIAIVAENEGIIIGILDLWYFPDVGHGAALGIIMNFIVQEEFRKRGVGGKLFEEANRIAKELKLHELHVWTDFKNKDAIGVYKSHGFVNECLLLEKEFMR